jgi:NADH-quinone oxidoreductase subunit A
MLNEYVPILVIFVLAAGFVATMLLGAIFLGPVSHTEMKDDPFECGTVGTGNPNDRLSVKFYLVAVIFILFDIEIVFMYPWAVQALLLGWSGFVAMMSFLSIVAFGLFYVWKRGVLDWT